MTKKINEGSGTLNFPEFKAVVDRLTRKEPELDELARLLTDQEREDLDRSAQGTSSPGSTGGEWVGDKQG